MDRLRYEFLIECAGLLQSYSTSLACAADRENAETTRIYFDCIRAVGKDMAKTLEELERDIRSVSRRADERERTEAGRANAPLRRDNAERFSVADGA